MKQTIFLLMVFTVIFALGALSQESVKESSTGKYFPAQVSFKSGGKDYTLSVTGLTVRKKLFFKVYGIAHYMENPGSFQKAEEAVMSILTDGKAKQITMDFSRDVDAAKIKEAYTDGFKEHSTPEELQKIQPLINQFIGYFSKDVKENDQFILRWLPGGSVVAIMQGIEKPVIADQVFARILWTIWFGESSIVDREELIEKILK